MPSILAPAVCQPLFGGDAVAKLSVIKRAGESIFAAVISLINTISLAGRWRALSTAFTLISLAFVLASCYGFLPARRSNQYDKRADDHA